MSPLLLYTHRVARHFSPQPHILPGFVVAAKNVTVTRRQNNLRAGPRPVGKRRRSWTGDRDQKEPKMGGSRLVSLGATATPKELKALK